MKFLTSLNPVFIKSIIKNSKDLELVFIPLFSEGTHFLCSLLGAEFVRSIINDTSSLKRILDIFSFTPYDTEMFFKFLGAEFVRSIIKNAKDLKFVLHAFAYRIATRNFFNLLGAEFVRSTIKSAEDLILILPLLASNPGMGANNCLDFLGVEFVRSIIKNAKDLKLVLSSIPYEGDREHLSHLLGSDFTACQEKGNHSPQISTAPVCVEEAPYEEKVELGAFLLLKSLGSFISTFPKPAAVSEENAEQHASQLVTEMLGMQCKVSEHFGDVYFKFPVIPITNLKSYANQLGSKLGINSYAILLPATLRFKVTDDLQERGSGLAIVIERLEKPAASVYSSCSL